MLPAEQKSQQTHSDQANNYLLILKTFRRSAEIVDGEALVWAHNNGSTSIFSTDVPTGLPAGTEKRLGRAWMVEENNGDTGPVTISFDLATIPTQTGDASDFVLLIDDDGTFVNATKVTGGTLDGEVLSFAAQNLSDGDYLSLALPPQPLPGGITNALMWINAGSQAYVDAGSTSAVDMDTVQELHDQSISGYVFEQTAGASKPLYRTDQINGQPVLEFDGTNSKSMVMTSAIADPGNTFELFIVAQSDEAQVRALFSSAPGQQYEFRQHNSNQQVNTGGYIEQWPGDPIVPFTVSTTTPSMLDFKVTGGPPNTIEVFQDGTSIGSDSGSSNNIVWTTPNFGAIGVEGNYGGYMDGQIAEMILYPTELTDDTDRSKVESYLAIKYGMTLDQSTPQDYILSDGSVAWDASTVGTVYDEGIAGLVEDQNGNTDQVTSRSESDGSILVGTANATTLEDGESFVWSHNGGAVASWTDTESIGALERVAREWVIEENNGDVGLVTIRVDESDLPVIDESLFIGVNSTNDFSSGTATAQMTDQGAYWDVAINLSDGEFITFFEGGNSLSVNDNLSISASVTEAIVATFDSSTVSLTVDPTVNNGEDESEYTEITVSSNAGGYDVYAYMDDGNNGSGLRSEAGNTIPAGTGENTLSFFGTNVTFAGGTQTSFEGDATFATPGTGSSLLNSNGEDVDSDVTGADQKHTIYYDLDVNFGTVAGLYSGVIYYTVVPTL